MTFPRLDILMSARTFSMKESWEVNFKNKNLNCEYVHQIRSWSIRYYLKRKFNWSMTYIFQFWSQSPSLVTDEIIWDHFLRIRSELIPIGLDHVLHRYVLDHGLRNISAWKLNISFKPLYHGHCVDEYNSTEITKQIQQSTKWIGSYGWR